MRALCIGPWLTIREQYAVQHDMQAATKRDLHCSLSAVILSCGSALVALGIISSGLLNVRNQPGPVVKSEPHGLCSQLPITSTLV